MEVIWQWPAFAVLAVAVEITPLPTKVEHGGHVQRQGTLHVSSPPIDAAGVGSLVTEVEGGVTLICGSAMVKTDGVQIRAGEIELIELVEIAGDLPYYSGLVI